MDRKGVVLYTLILVGTLICIACDDLVVEGKLQVAQDDRIVGNWSDGNGALQAIVRRGPEGAYHRWSSADDFRQGKDPTVFFLVTVSGMLFAQQQSNCAEHHFKGPSRADATCWSVSRLVVTDKEIEWLKPNVSRIVSDSRAGLLKGIAHRHGTNVTKEGSSVTCVLLDGTIEENTAALATYGKSRDIYGSERWRRL